MRMAWFGFKLLEIFVGLTCFAIHIDGFLRVQVYSFYLNIISFVAIPSTCMFGCLSITMNSSPTVISEAAINTVAGVTYIWISINTMYYAEKEFYLMYLSELEQPLHPFFHYSKSQSIVTLTAGMLHTLHAVLAVDILVYQPKRTRATTGEELISARQPLQLYFLGKTVQTHMEQYEWFRRLAGRLQSEDRT